MNRAATPYPSNGRIKPGFQIPIGNYQINNYPDEEVEENDEFYEYSNDFGDVLEMDEAVFKKQNAFPVKQVRFTSDQPINQTIQTTRNTSGMNNNNSNNSNMGNVNSTNILPRKIQPIIKNTLPIIPQTNNVQIPYNISSTSFPIVEKEEMIFVPDRNQEIPVYMCFSKKKNPNSNLYPVLIASHGLGGNNLFLRYLFLDLASKGVLCVAPTHIGSDVIAVGSKDKLKQLPENEGVLRVTDIRSTLDYLEKQNNDPLSPFYKSLDLDHVIAIGHSFGGTTVLAMTGSPVLPWTSTGSKIKIAKKNKSEKLQWREKKDYAKYKDILRDDRIKSVISIDAPFSILFYLSKSKIPIDSIVSSLDTLVPMAYETPSIVYPSNSKVHRSVVLENVDHFMIIDVCYWEKKSIVCLPTSTILENPKILKNIDPKLINNYDSLSTQSKRALVRQVNSFLSGSFSPAVV